MFLEILQNSQESACVRVSFLIKLQAWCFPKFLRITIFTEHLRWLLLSKGDNINLERQGRSQNLKEVSQSFTEVFNIDDLTANDVIQKNQHRKEKKT